MKPKTQLEVLRGQKQISYDFFSLAHLGVAHKSGEASENSHRCTLLTQMPIGCVRLQEGIFSGRIEFLSAVRGKLLVIVFIFFVLVSVLLAVMFLTFPVNKNN